MMIAFFALAVITASIAALLWLRSRQVAGLPGRVDGWAGRTLGVVALVLAVAAPVEPVRAVLGFGTPKQCAVKPHSQPPAIPEVADIELLKAEIRQRRLEAGLSGPTVEAIETREVARLTGSGSVNATDDRWNVFGTDLGHPFTYKGRLGLLFGDTFGDAARGGWRSNVLAWAERPAPDRLVFTGMPGNGPAPELVGSLKLRGWEETAIPTNAVAVGDRIVLHYMSVVCWGLAGSWLTDHAGLAISDDGGRSFSRTLEPRWAGDGGFVQVAFVPHGDHLYAFGIPSGRAGPVRLARVAANRVTDGKAWRYWDGGGWVDDPAGAVALVSPPVGELSVQWNEQYDRWVMMYLHEARGGIVLRTAEHLTGPWSAAELVASGIDFPQLYAPYLLPPTGDGRGPATYFTMSRYDTYNVYLMHTRLMPAREPPRVLPY